jgi:hypothetical protein
LPESTPLGEPVSTTRLIVSDAIVIEPLDVPLNDPPLLTFTEPPVVALAPPTIATLLLPLLSDPEMRILPAAPSEARPVVIATLPLAPIDDALPLSIEIDPVTPSYEGTGTLAVVISTAPLVPEALDPLATLNAPPSPPVDLPDETMALPPLWLALRPPISVVPDDTTSSLLLLEPPVSDTVPVEPSLLAPLCTIISPLSLRASESPL